MSIATVVLRGFGTGSYADINKLPTLGYSHGAAIAVQSGRMEYTVPANRLEYTVPDGRLKYTVTE
jgi:hypothetical protein